MKLEMKEFLTLLMLVLFPWNSSFYFIIIFLVQEYNHFVEQILFLI